MKLCDTCIYRNNVEQLKPCIIYRDNCEYYEREEDMKAIIQIDVPDYQIGQEVSIYFKDTMMIKGIVQEPSGDLISRQALQEWIKDKTFGDIVVASEHNFDCLPSVNPQEPKMGQWIDREIYDADRWKCSECGRTEQYKENYCPNCGARMESEDDNT